MAYPRLLKLSSAVEDKLTSYLLNEITQHLAERSDFDAELEQYQEDYNAIPKETKDFPFKNACSIIIPIIAISFETTHAAVMSTIFGLDNQLLEVAPSSEEYSDAGYHFSNFANRYLLKNADFKKSIESSFIELEKFGTGIAKAIYEKKTKYGIREIGGVEHEFPVIVKDGISIKSIPVSRYLLPYEYQDSQFCKWSGESHRLTPHQIKQMELDGLFYKGTFDDIKNSISNNTSETNQFESDQEVLENHQPNMPERITFYEIWLSFNVTSADDEDEDPEKEIQVFYCKDHNLLMGAFYNQYSDLRKPHRLGNYVKVENRAFGIGICKQADQFQREITIQHRQRIDNATIANIRMFKVSKQSGYGPNEPVMPGKMWFLDDMKDIESFQLGEIYPSAYNNEQQSLLYLQQRVGTNELNQGLPQVGTPGTATSDLARLQEAKRKFDYVCENIKSFTLDVAMDSIDIIRDRQLVRYATPIETQYVNQILANPSDVIRSGTVVNITLAGAQSNKILDAQKWDSLAPKLQSYYTSMFQLAHASGDKNMMALIIKKAITGGNEAMKQVLESADIRNIDSFLLNDLITMMSGGTNNAQITSGQPTVDPNSQVIPQNGVLPSSNGMAQ